ncbi:MAG TPA: H-type lectin domain-containing protein [Roseimicrobium sp.]|nr:H-type lectin domain-containing protein [Roseimicrobium sp.]
MSAEVHVGILTEAWNLATPPDEYRDETRVFRFQVYFSAPFDEPPIVQLGLTGFDIDHRDTARLTVAAREINKEGFIAEFTTWRETRVYSAAFSWLALGA